MVVKSAQEKESVWGWGFVDERGRDRDNGSKLNREGNLGEMKAYSIAPRETQKHKNTTIHTSETFHTGAHYLYNAPLLVLDIEQ